jgi:two-component system phosphate regulon sensor histidine kinase PhoR
MRRDFVSNLSHEMRTPLTVISGYLETLADHSDEVPANWQRAVFTMADQSARMEALIADLILLSKIETGDGNLHESVVDAGALLRQVCDDANALSGNKQHRIELAIDGPTQIRGDLSQLRSAVSNLVFNAVKYTPAQGKIRVRWSAGEQGPLLTVEDNGTGIDPAHIPRLTERFYRADPSRHKDTGGTGLGLAIVKHVLLNHDGQLLISSSPGKGSTFRCQFPAERVVASAASAAQPLESGQ